MYFASRLQGATNTIVENQRVITKVYFPRLVLPISAVLVGTGGFRDSFLMFLLHDGLLPHSCRRAAIFWLPLFLLLAVLTALGVGLWLSALNAMYRDVRYVVPFLVQFWMFASPVAYPSSPGASKVALAVRVESDGRRDRGISLGAHRARAAAWTRSWRVRGRRAVVLLFWRRLAYFQRMEATIADVV